MATQTTTTINITTTITDATELPAPVPYRLWRLSLLRQPGADELAWLSAQEHGQAAAFHFDVDRRRYVAAHVALRRILAQCVATQPADLVFEIGAFGKPWLHHERACAFNLSHCQDVALVAVAVAPAGHIGVDVELHRAVPEAPGMAALNFTATECRQLAELSGTAHDAAFLRCWTRKEACLKAIGSGFSISPKTFEVGIEPDDRSVVVPGANGPHTLQVASLPDGDGQYVALARVVDRRPPGPVAFNR